MLYIDRLYLKNYRNLKEENLKFSPALNLFVGRNAQGKTNILESLYLLGTGASHRTNNIQHLVNWDNDYFLLKTFIYKKNRELSITYSYNDSKKEIKIDNNPLQKISDLMGYINVVLFSPEDLQMVKGSPALRRRFLNLEISQVNPYYYHNLQKYNQVIKHRNILLKELKSDLNRADKVRNMLFIWDQQLVDLGSRIIKKRLEVLQKIDILARLIHRRITDGQENLKIEYKSTLGKITGDLKREDIQKLFAEKLIDEFQNEINRGSTQIGPHLDDLEFYINDINVRQFGSQGQQRTTALALKISELEFMKSEIGEYPILLLDDVFSELDFQRKKHLLDVIKDKIQTFITSTDSDSFKEIQNNKYYLFTVKEGSVELKKGCD